MPAEQKKPVKASIQVGVRQAMTGTCVMCSSEFDSSDTTFEQRLVDDTSFCIKCWMDIMTSEYDGDYVMRIS